MALSGVDQMVLVNSFSAYEHYNQYCADAAAATLIASLLSPGSTGWHPGPPDTLSSWVDGRGMRSVRIGTADCGSGR